MFISFQPSSKSFIEVLIQIHMQITHDGAFALIEIVSCLSKRVILICSMIFSCRRLLSLSLSLSAFFFFAGSNILLMTAIRLNKYPNRNTDTQIKLNTRTNE